MEAGAGVFYKNNVAGNIFISGANIIQDNKTNGKLNNLNISYNYNNTTLVPINIEGSLDGSKIGLSDPKLWIDGLTDEDSTAISLEKLTIGYKENNTDIHPSKCFTSDHNTWVVDYGDNTLKTESFYGLASTSTRASYQMRQMYAFKTKSATGRTNYFIL